jgi:ubiquitin thioesterase OTU1
MYDKLKMFLELAHSIVNCLILIANIHIFVLINSISFDSGISESRLKLLAGFPPKTLDLVNTTRALSDVGIKSGDVIMAQERPASPAAAPTPAVTVPTPTPIIPDPSYYSELPSGAGMLLRHVVPSDNSCLFTSIGYVLNGTPFFSPLFYPC